MNAFWKTLLMAIGTIAWGAIVTWFHGEDPATSPFLVNFHHLWLAIASALFPTIVAYFMKPPTTPPTPPTPPTT